MNENWDTDKASGYLPDVIYRQYLMVDDAFYQIERSPAQHKLSGKRFNRGNGVTMISSTI